MNKASWMDTPDKFVYRTTTGTLITPYKTNFSPELEKRYSIRKRGRNYLTPFTGFYLAKQHSFVCPPDIPVNKLVETYLPGYKAVTLYPNPSKSCYPFKIYLDSLREQQDEFIQEAKLCIEQGHKRIFCNMQTGYGKTISMICMMAYHHKKTVIITYVDNLIQQWYETIRGMTDFPEDRILKVKGSSTLEKMREDPFTYEDYDFFLISHELLSSYGKRYGYEYISEIFANLGIGVKVYDEAHHSIRSMITIDSYTNVEYTYYLTADYSQSNDSKMWKYRSIFKGVPILPSKNKGTRYVTCLSMIFNSHPPFQDYHKIQFGMENGFSIMEYTKYQIQHPHIYQCIDAILDKLFSSKKFDLDGRILIFTTLIEGVEKIYRHIRDTYGEIPGGIAMHYSDMNPEDKAYAKNEARVIVATYGSFGVGVDAPNIQCVISCDMISRIQANQAAGRVRPSSDPSRYALFVMLYDDAFDYCQHTRKKIVNYLKEGKGKSFINYYMEK